MGSLAEALDAARTPSGRRCSLCADIAELPQEDREAFAAACADSSFQHTQLAKALAAVGIVRTESTIRRHRMLCGTR